MGVSLISVCLCGYEVAASVGSSRSNHGKVFVFPHKCTKCKALVNVDLLQQPNVCPECSSAEIVRYGWDSPKKMKTHQNWFQKLFAPKPLAEANETPEVDDSVVSAYCYNLKTTFKLGAGGNQCPKCGEQSLRFQVPDVQID